MPSSALLPFLLLVFFATLTIVGVAMVALDKSERELKKEHPELIEGIEPSDSYFGRKFPYIHAVRIKNRLALKQMQEAEDKLRVSWVINQENPVPRLAN